VRHVQSPGAGGAREGVEWGREWSGGVPQIDQEIELQRTK
jgi:hypothetical protein